MFLPTTKKELNHLGWDRPDIILVTGDAYIDSPYMGIAVIGKILTNAGYRVAVIGQPDPHSSKDICRLGEPLLFWGVSGGCIDSMVANLTATGKKRQSDDYTPGGINNKRPNRAVIVYSNLIRQHFKQTRPIVLGGLEASLRRIAHYDHASKKIRRSILCDSKADYLLYGMAEQSVVELAKHLKEDTSPLQIKGLCYMAPTAPGSSTLLPSYTEVSNKHDAFESMFNTFYHNNNPLNGVVLAQLQDARFLVQNPPHEYLNQQELDAIYNLNFERDLHPYHQKKGSVKALDTIRFSITTHQGCYGECNFCAIAVHQGRTVRSRSKESILAEARSFLTHPAFKGIISDVGGPTGNMYGFECAKKLKKGPCRDKRCLFPNSCPSLKINHRNQIELLRALRSIKGIRKVFVASGIRYDMIIADKQQGAEYLGELIKHHISGQLKIAPEHCIPHVLDKMGKPGVDSLLTFRNLFLKLAQKYSKKVFLTYYMIAAHPGCTQKDMAALHSFCSDKLKLLPEQVQIFTPTPSTYSTLMYHTKRDPFKHKSCFVESHILGKDKQKMALLRRSNKGFSKKKR